MQPSPRRMKETGSIGGSIGVVLQIRVPFRVPLIMVPNLENYPYEVQILSQSYSSICHERSILMFPALNYPL